MSETKQHTLATTVTLEGVGLHSGKPVVMTLRPAAVDTGIVFARTDLDGAPVIHALASNITSTMRATTLSENGAEVYTIEHLMAAFAIMAVDNCVVELTGPEPPVADGSALTFVKLIEEAGLVEQEAKRRYLKLSRSYSVTKGDIQLHALPNAGYKITFTSINPHPLLGTQLFAADVEEREAMVREVAPARTVAFAEEIEALHKAGLGLGGTIENVVVFDKDKVLTPQRFADELVRHKLLDVVGDLYLLGPLKAQIIAVKSGHAYNAAMMQEIWKVDKAKQLEEERKAHMITLDINQIKEIIPHRYPMLLVDRITELEPMKRAIGIKNITANEMQFLGHFPNEPIMPGVLLIEAMAQVGGVAMLYPEENRGKIAVFARIDNVRFRRPIVPGDQLVTEAVLTKVYRANMGVIHCDGRVDGKPACECDCTFVIMDKKG